MKLTVVDAKRKAHLSAPCDEEKMVAQQERQRRSGRMTTVGFRRVHERRSSANDIRPLRDGRDRSRARRRLHVRWS